MCSYSFSLPHAGHGVIWTGPSTLAIFDREARGLFEFGLRPDSRLFPIVSFCASSQGKPGKTTARVLEHVVAERGRVVVFREGLHDLWVLRESSRARTLGCVGSFYELRGLSPSGRYLTVSTSSGMLVADTMKDRVLTRVENCNALKVLEDDLNRCVMVYADDANHVRVIRNDTERASLLMHVEGDAMRIAGIDARFSPNGDDVEIAVLFSKVDEDSLAARTRILRFLYQETNAAILPRDIPKEFPHMAYDVRILPNGKLAIFWAHLDAYLLQIGTQERTYPRSRIPPAIRGDLVAWIDDDALLRIQRVPIA